MSVKDDKGVHLEVGDELLSNQTPWRTVAMVVRGVFTT
jgi:hypothetical protein